MTSTTTPTPPVIVTPAGDNRWTVASRSQPDAPRVVTCEAGTYACTCPGYVHRGYCRHVTAVSQVNEATRPRPVRRPWVEEA